MKISACLITKNEEHNITNCIESFKDSVDEIIVVDTGSEDKTVEIAQSLGAQVYSQDWDRNFSNAKNFALSKASGDWIVFLDADEFFYSGTGMNIAPVLQEIDTDSTIDVLNCKFYDLDSEGNRKMSGYRPRIFRNYKDLRFRGTICEALEKEGPSPVNYFYVEDEKLIIHHTGYSTPELSDTKYSRDLEMLVDEYYAGAVRPAVYAYLSSRYSWAFNYDLAMQSARHFINSGYTLEGQNVSLRINLITTMRKAGNKPEEIISEINRSLEIFPDHPDLNSMLAAVLYDEKKYEAALQALEDAIRYCFTYKGFEDTSFFYFIDKAYVTLGKIHELKNDLPSAESWYIKALCNNKWNTEGLTNLLKLVRKRHPDLIITLINSLYDENNVKDIKFVIEILGTMRIKSVFAYYYNILTNRFQEEHISFLFGLLCDGRFEEAFQYFTDLHLENIEWAGNLAVVSALLSKNPERIREVTQLKPSFERIIVSFMGAEKNMILSEEDILDYLFLLNELVYLSAEDEVNILLKLKDCFNEDYSDKIGQVFFDSGDYEKAVSLFTEGIKNNKENKKDLYFKAGLSFYKMSQLEKAEEHMEKAIKSGYNSNDVYEVLQWIKARVA